MTIMTIELSDMQLFLLAERMAEEIFRNVLAARNGVRSRTVLFRDNQRTVCGIEDYFRRLRMGAFIKERLDELFAMNGVARTGGLRARLPQTACVVAPLEVPMTAAQHNAFPRGRWS